MMAPHALIFDVDGTLADTETLHLAAFNAAFDQLQLGWHWQPDVYRPLLDVTGGKERLAHHIGLLPIASAARCALQLQVPVIHALKTRIYASMVASGALALRPGVERLLHDARQAGCMLGIASTTTAANIDALLQATLKMHGAALFSVIVCGDHVPAKKPAPDVYLLALRQLGVKAYDAVAFEDSIPGLRSAQAAGLCTVVTPSFWTDDADFSGADLLLPDLGSLAFDDLGRLLADRHAMTSAANQGAHHAHGR